MTEKSEPAPSLPPNYTLIACIPTALEYQRLRRLAGCHIQFPLEVSKVALPYTIHSAIVQYTPPVESNSNPDALPAPATTVAMGRLVGDGKMFLQIVDMAVDPAHQRKGLGRCVLYELMSWRDREAKDAFVSLISDSSAVKLYEDMGFSRFGFGQEGLDTASMVALCYHQ